jgi:hypothetical protein
MIKKKIGWTDSIGSSNNIARKRKVSKILIMYRCVVVALYAVGDSRQSV